MRFRQATLKLISLFVLAFLCLNAGGFLCLTYCGQIVKAKADSCPLKAAAHHCPHSQAPAKTTGDHSASAGSISCCTMPIGMIAPAPLETKTRVDVPAAVATVVEAAVIDRPILRHSRQISGFYYRPPPNDRRQDRVRNQVFRI
jgi:hypothetical protein